MDKNAADPSVLSLLEAIEEIPFGMILTDHNGSVLGFNKGFRSLSEKSFHQALSGQKLETLLSKAEQKDYLEFMSKFDNDSPPETSKKIFDLVDKGKMMPIELAGFYHSKTREWLFVGISLEETNIVKLEKELEGEVREKKNLQDELEHETELGEMKSRFLSIASHEFRTPLAGILSSLNLIDRYLDSDAAEWNKFRHKEKIENHLNKIHVSVKNLTTILNRFLSLRNIEKGEIPVKYTKFNLCNLIEDQLTQFREISKEGQSIKYRHSGKNKLVNLDKHLFRNILNNLLSNAIKFSAESAVISVRSKIDNASIMLEVEDQGIGIPEADQKNIFHRFYRAKNALSVEEGTGLGLSIVKKYVELMEGSIHFISEENKGTTFMITFSK